MFINKNHLNIYLNIFENIKNFGKKHFIYNIAIYSFKNRF